MPVTPAASSSHRMYPWQTLSSPALHGSTSTARAPHCWHLWHTPESSLYIEALQGILPTVAFTYSTCTEDMLPYVVHQSVVLIRVRPCTSRYTCIPTPQIASCPPCPHARSTERGSHRLHPAQCAPSGVIKYPAGHADARADSNNNSQNLRMSRRFRAFRALYARLSKQCCFLFTCWREEPGDYRRFRVLNL